MSTAFGISDDGRRVVFESSAPDIVAGDTNDQLDVFVYDDRTRRSTRVSVGPKGRQADSYSLGGRISGDGRYAAFGSAATNLVAGDTNGQSDVFLHDLLAGRTYRASLAGYGAQLDGASLLHDISDDGKEVAFESFAPNAVPGDTNGVYDVFVRDADDGSTTRVSLAADGAEPDAASGRPVISGDGRHVAFESSRRTSSPAPTAPPATCSSAACTDASSRRAAHLRGVGRPAGSIGPGDGAGRRWQAEDRGPGDLGGRDAHRLRPPGVGARGGARGRRARRRRRERAAGSGALGGVHHVQLRPARPGRQR